ncbi:MAG: dicarboxylate/amino acid:cation symporter [Flavobacteriales bacterium]|nr:dicarboxylate/amino acid:cation symporter [Flavobacteriales bacterium]MCW8913271.1 dicarboxylate/amino acid:cation symporter [Flavobacteriales bacterium]MCW8938949.1 dicarboxylate/amino acid:cation symporter [Flavobacteriales bacterium]MCW8939412.1 dicarboxylate/amino acid:cation symporter [Flavobacteriales bacterium]MCW8968201.1 dicarboxylate/amino acid:cation symporter [Flavobacteriales bacterium]
MKKLALHWKIIIGLLLGIIWAYVSAVFGWSTFTKNWIAPWGEIFINLLKLIAIPLVLFSIIVGISGLSDIKRLGRVGAKTLGIYLLTTVFAVSLGLVLVNLIKPGKYLDENQRVKNRITYELWAQENNIEIKDHQSYLTNPDYTDFVDDASQQYEVEKSLAEVDQDLAKRKQEARRTKEAGPLAFLIDMVPSNIFVSLADNKLMLQIIFFAIFFGVVLLMIDKKKADNVAGIVDGFNEVFLKMVDIVMKAAPFFVFALMAAKLSEMAGDDPKAIQDIIINLGWYSLVVVIGLAFLVFVVYPLIMTRVLKISYTSLFRKISPAQLLAFSSSSSAATLPITMECVNDNLKVPEEVSSFVLPIGATVNMDGTSLYQSIAVIYLAQIHLIDLDMAQQLTIVATATLASIGSAAVPSAGLVMLMIVLDAVGLNPAWIAIIFPVDRILDMMRTVVNVTGDITVSSVIAKSEGFMKK